MTTVENSPCPACDAPGKLYYNVLYSTDPIGTASLAGHQMKTTMYKRPVLRCGACLMRLVGDFDPDGKHITFRPPVVWEYEVDDDAA